MPNSHGNSDTNATKTGQSSSDADSAAKSDRKAKAEPEFVVKTDDGWRRIVNV